MRGLCTSERGRTLGARESRSERAAQGRCLRLFQVELPNQFTAEDFAHALAIGRRLRRGIPGGPDLLLQGLDAVTETVEGGHVLVSNDQVNVGVVRRARLRLV